MRDYGILSLSPETRAVQGLATTFQLLAKTENEAALGVLLPALDCPQAAIQEGALAALVERRSPAAGREILRRIPTMSSRWQSILSQHHGRLLGALRDAVLDRQEQRCRNGCQAAVWFREYDLIPTLLAVMQDAASAHADLAAATMLELLESLYDELAGTQPAQRPPRPATDSPPGGRQPGAGGGAVRAAQAAGGDRGLPVAGRPRQRHAEARHAKSPPPGAGADDRDARREPAQGRDPPAAGVPRRRPRAGQRAWR